MITKGYTFHMDNSNSILENKLGDLMKDLSKEVMQHYVNWINLLTKGSRHGQKRVIELYNKHRYWGSTIMTYRKELKKEGRGVVNTNLIIRAYFNRDINKLRELLSEKCLESLSNDDIELFLSCLHRRGWDIDKVLRKMNRRPNGRLMSLVL